MSDELYERIEVRLVLEAIHDRYGYDFRGYAEESMRRRVQAALARSGAAHLGDLQHRLLMDPAFFASVLDDLTVRVSGMFRGARFYRALRERVAPVLRTYPHLKVWHAGCASGEEVYATAIVLSEENLYDRTQIYATDMSLSALEQAREGVYPDSELPLFKAGYEEAGGVGQFEEYCTQAYGRVAIRERLRKNLVFFQHDLVGDYALGEMHLILCRNVLIYFGTALRERVLDMFASGLYRGGFLCLGDSEALPGSRARLFDEFAGLERIYRKRGAA